MNWLGWLFSRPEAPADPDMIEARRRLKLAQERAQHAKHRLDQVVQDVGRTKRGVPELFGEIFENESAGGRCSESN